MLQFYNHNTIVHIIYHKIIDKSMKKTAIIGDIKQDSNICKEYYSIMQDNTEKRGESYEKMEKID